LVLEEHDGGHVAAAGGDLNVHGDRGGANMQAKDAKV
jgi:hypothetical protein